jgi:hypothetical protein
MTLPVFLAHVPRGKAFRILSNAKRNGTLCYEVAIHHFVTTYGVTSQVAQDVIVDWLSSHAEQEEARRKRRRVV